MRKLVSFCIPVYNGADTLGRFLDTLLPEIDDRAEVILCDDRSTDGTYELALEYAESDDRVKVYRNDKNLGMDRNFAHSARLGSGEFVWLAGQDDRFGSGFYDKFLDILVKQPDVDLVYFNYRYLNEAMTGEMFPPQLSIESDLVFQGGLEYFKVFDHAPSFLTATIMRRKHWDSAAIEDFFDTKYVQVGCWLVNAHDAKIYVVASSEYVECCYGENSWKVNDGQMLFEIFSGNLEVYHRVHALGVKAPFDRGVYFSMKHDYLRKFARRTLYCFSLGMRRTEILRKRMRFLFQDNPLLYYLYILPFYHFPKTLARPTYRLATFLKMPM